MKFLISEQLSPNKYKTPEGYLICIGAILARTGKQEYKRNEVFPMEDSDEVISIDRKPEQVFDEKTLASFENKPVTCEHPNCDVNSENYKDYSVGFVRNVRKGQTENGEDVIIGDLVIQDADIIKDIEEGYRTELSCGYDCDITDSDEPEQINIRGNHVALCERGRAGIAKIVDSDYIKDMALSRSDAMERCISLGKRFIEHFDKFYKEKNSQAANHWSKEMQNWLNSVKSIVLKENNKPILNGNLRDWFFTAGANPENYMKNPTSDELEAYDKFVTSVINTNNVHTSLKELITDSIVDAKEDDWFEVWYDKAGTTSEGQFKTKEEAKKYAKLVGAKYIAHKKGYSYEIINDSIRDAKIVMSRHDFDSATTYYGEDEPDITWLANNYSININRRDHDVIITGDRLHLYKFYKDHYLSDWKAQIEDTEIEDSRGDVHIKVGNLVDLIGFRTKATTNLKILQISPDKRKVLLKPTLVDGPAVWQSIGNIAGFNFIFDSVEDAEIPPTGTERTFLNALSFSKREMDKYSTEPGTYGGVDGMIEGVAQAYYLRQDEKDLLKKKLNEYARKMNYTRWIRDSVKDNIFGEVVWQKEDFTITKDKNRGYCVFYKGDLIESDYDDIKDAKYNINKYINNFEKFKKEFGPGREKLFKDADPSAIQFLIRDEEEAIKGYEKALLQARVDGDEVAVAKYQHIMEEELEHIQELKDLLANDIHKGTHDSLIDILSKAHKNKTKLKFKITQIKKGGK